MHTDKNNCGVLPAITNYPVPKDKKKAVRYSTAGNDCGGSVYSSENKPF